MRTTMFRLWNAVFNENYNQDILASVDSDGVVFRIFNAGNSLRIPHDDWAKLLKFIKEEMEGEDATSDS